MELISEYFSWCEGGRKSGIDPGVRVLGSALEEEEEEVVVGIMANGKNERQCIGGKKKRVVIKIRARKWERMKYIYIQGVFLHFTSN